jgi:hypothetical protein
MSEFKIKVMRAVQNVPLDMWKETKGTPSFHWRDSSVEGVFEAQNNDVTFTIIESRAENDVCENYYCDLYANGMDAADYMARYFHEDRHNNFTEGEKAIPDLLKAIKNAFAQKKLAYKQEIMDKL